MKTKSELIRLWPKDPNMRELISSLWRDLPTLYSEKAEGEIVRNKFLYDVDFAQALGQGNILGGNKSVSIGEGNITSSFLEIIIGAFASVAETQNMTEWIATDRLVAIGNGIDSNNRSCAIEIFKSGLAKLKNAVEIGVFAHGTNNPEAGTIQFLNDKLQLYFTEAWHEILTDSPSDDHAYGRKNKLWIKVAEEDHDHEIGNQVLLFENALI